MKKIPTMFLRDPATNLRHVMNEPHPDCGWVFEGHGAATRKYDGTCVMIRSGKMFKRREVKKGKPEPSGFELVEEDTITGKKVGWVAVGDVPEDRWHREALTLNSWADGTYELCGPKVQSNAEEFSAHVLIPHGSVVLENIPRDFDGIARWLQNNWFEGVVFHHPDGRMAKIKKRDFPSPESER